MYASFNLRNLSVMVRLDEGTLAVALQCLHLRVHVHHGDTHTLTHTLDKLLQSINFLILLILYNGALL